MNGIDRQRRRPTSLMKMAAYTMIYIYTLLLAHGAYRAGRMRNAQMSVSVSSDAFRYRIETLKLRV